MAIPARPVPKRNIIAGSGTGASLPQVAARKARLNSINNTFLKEIGIILPSIGCHNVNVDKLVKS